MHKANPSRTAQRVAVRRAAHQLLDHPKVFEDSLAIAMAGVEAARELQQLGETDAPFARSLRAFIAVRSRYAEDQLALAVARGVRQYVVLGAGLDTFAYRNPWRSAGLRVFEIDHPATQEWKRAQLQQAGIAVPPEMTFAPLDFERQPLDDALRAAGFDPTQPSFFSWLGVTPYLSRPPFDATLQFIARRPAASGAVFDYAVDRSLLSARQQAALDALAARVAYAGEPFRLFFHPTALAADLARMGFCNLEDLAADQINARYFAGRSDGLSVSGGGRLLSAWVS
jgi:methyltransferase (TIGR00027 family)